MAKCTFCGDDTDFLAHSEHLCLRCGDKIQTYTPAKVLDMAIRFAECVAMYKADLTEEKECDRSATGSNAKRP